MNRLIEEHRAEDAQRFGVATIETVNIVENFCSMHLGVNLRKAFLTGIDCKDTSHACDDPFRKYHRVDSLVHEFCNMFGRHGVPEYTCGVQSFPVFLTLMATNIESSRMKQYFEKCASISLDRQVGSRYFVTAGTL